MKEKQGNGASNPEERKTEHIAETSPEYAEHKKDLSREMGRMTFSPAFGSRVLEEFRMKREALENEREKSQPNSDHIHYLETGIEELLKSPREHLKERAYFFGSFWVETARFSGEAVFNF